MGDCRRIFERCSFRGDKGDSLLEVILAISVLSVVAVGSMAVMNRGNALAQVALGRTETRASINTQSQLLQYARTDPTLWANVKNVSYSDTANATNYTPRSANGSSAARSFYLDNDGNVVANAMSQSILPFGSGQLWIDGVCPPASWPNYCDFYIKANWSAAGTANKGVTIVRLYD